MNFRIFSEIFFGLILSSPENFKNDHNYLFFFWQVVKLVKRNNSESMVQLTPISVFANQMYSLLYEHRGRIQLSNFESAYFNKFRKQCQATQFGFQTLSALLQAIPETVSLQNNGYYTHKRIITLNNDLKSKKMIILGLKFSH